MILLLHFTGANRKGIMKPIDLLSKYANKVFTGGMLDGRRKK